jgi:secondary thiamine-phosphate synthase enzyme
MHWIQERIALPARPRGVHLVTDALLRELPDLRTICTGVLHLFLQHTSASLSLNENASPAVRGDIERHLNEMVPENQPYYEHTLEGPDDMPAHIKAVLMGESLTIPIASGELALGTWQGIYLNEHRNEGGTRYVVATAWGQPRNEA